MGEILMAKIDLWQNWPEWMALFLLLVGFIFATVATSAVMSYLIIFLSGGLFGRLWYSMKKNFQFSFFMVIIGFLIGYLLGGSFIRYGNKGIMIIFFVFGWVAAYYLHIRGIIKSRAV
tara:strand:+ start:2424 stop:2777 length:354 start_codon:yes stop_codon:yes gene_type:complete